jgi:hypothetical protein
MAHAELGAVPARVRTKNINKMNGLDRKFCIAPMMDWSEITIHSTRYETACAKIAHACSTLSFAFVLTKKLPELRICFGLYATIAMRTHRTISVAFARYQDNPSSLIAHRLLLLPPKLRI